jgi:hypothetical protein
LKKNVVIVGTAETTRNEAKKHYGKKTYEIWGLNQAYVTMPSLTKHATGWFQLHKRERWLERDPGHIDWLQKVEFPVWMTKVHKDIPSSEKYPLKAILGRFRRYFNNSLSWMMALAIHQGAKKIYLYGCDMAMDVEYIGQRPSLEYFVGLAEGMGIDVLVPPDCDLLKAADLYGFDDTNCLYEKSKTHRNWLGDKINIVKLDMLKARDEEMRTLGAISSTVRTDEQREVGRNRIKKLQQKQMDLRDQMNQYIGQQAAWEYKARCWGHE